MAIGLDVAAEREEQAHRRTARHVLQQRAIVAEGVGLEHVEPGRGAEGFPATAPHQSVDGGDDDLRQGQRDTLAQRVWRRDQLAPGAGIEAGLAVLVGCGVEAFGHQPVPACALRAAARIGRRASRRSRAPARARSRPALRPSKPGPESARPASALIFVGGSGGTGALSPPPPPQAATAALNAASVPNSTSRVSAAIGACSSIIANLQRAVSAGASKQRKIARPRWPSSGQGK